MVKDKDESKKKKNSRKRNFPEINEDNYIMKWYHPKEK